VLIGLFDDAGTPSNPNLLDAVVPVVEDLRPLRKGWGVPTRLLVAVPPAGK
jgi:hypothetical protein